MKSLINGQDLIDEFLALQSQGATPNPTTNIQLSNIVGINPLPVPMDIQIKLPKIYNPASGANKYKEIFHGNLQSYQDDQSKADFALCGYLARQGLTPQEADSVFRVSKLFRPKWDEKRGNETYGERTLRHIFSNIQENHSPTAPTINKQTKSTFSDIEAYRPNYVAQGMPPRQFVGPQIANGIRLFPDKALSTLVALGAMGKTSLLVSIACHVAAGKAWNNQPLNQQKVAMFFCEENQEEIDRKFSAVIELWADDEQQAAIDNLRLISLAGVDARITAIDKGHYRGSGIAEEIITLLAQFKLKNGLIILDHMQGFTAGDLNISETATALCREANKIIQATDSAVVMAAHIGKNNIKAEEFEQGFAVGSLAFENAVRQMSGLIPMTKEKATKFGLENTRKEYAWLSLAKNSYGGTNEGVWLKKVYSPNFHTIAMEPIVLSVPIATAKLNGFQKVVEQIRSYISSHPNTTRNTIEKLSGLKGQFKASKAITRDAINELIRTGDVKIHQVTDLERKELHLPKQVKEVLQVNNVKSAVKVANLNSLENWSAD